MKYLRKQRITKQSIIVSGSLNVRITGLLTERGRR